MTGRPIRIATVLPRPDSICTGKASPDYWHDFEKACRKRGIKFTLIKGLVSLKLHRMVHKFDLYIIPFNETVVLLEPFKLQKLKQIENELAGELVINTSDTAKIIGHKSRLNSFLHKVGVPVPQQYFTMEDKISYPVFSIDNIGSGLPIEEHTLGELPFEKCCTQLIDTTIEMSGRKYFSYIRAITTGDEILAITPRFRQIENRNRSVHGKDAPLDPQLFNEAYRQIVEPRISAIRKICSKLAKVLPMGSYAHDILPEAGTEKIYVCETGWKFYDRPMQKYTSEIRSQITEFEFHNFEMVQKQVAVFEHFVHQNQRNKSE